MFTLFAAWWGPGCAVRHIAICGGWKARDIAGMRILAVQRPSRIGPSAVKHLHLLSPTECNEADVCVGMHRIARSDLKHVGA